MSTYRRAARSNAADSTSPKPFDHSDWIFESMMDGIQGRGVDLFAARCERDLEGIVGKGVVVVKLQSPCEAGFVHIIDDHPVRPWCAHCGGCRVCRR